MAKRLHSGDLREVFALQAPSRVFTRGEEDVTWVDVDECSDVRGAIEYESESERVRAGRNEGRESIKIMTRKGLPATPEHRIVWRSEAFQIVGFPRFIDARRLWIKFTAIRTDIAVTENTIEGGFLFDAAENSHYIPLA